MYQQFTFLCPDGAEFTGPSDVHIRKAFILTLPFRLRVGARFTVPVDDSFDVVLRNPLDIPLDTSPEDLRKLWSLEGKLRPREQFFTTALILDKDPSVSAASCQQLLDFIRNPDNGKLPQTETRYFQAFMSLNAAIVGYHHATRALFGGTVVERLTTPRFFDRLRYLHTIVSPLEYELSEDDLTEVFDARSDRMITSIGGQFSADLNDLPLDRLTEIQRYTQLHQKFLYYQFALDAKSKMVEQDFVSAILFAVVALEAVLFVLLQMRLNQQLAATTPDPDDRANQAEKFANQMLQNIGITESLEITSLLFLHRDDQPSQEELQQCKLGIRIRNDIMHAVTKKGQYRLRNRTNQQITHAYTSVLKLYERFAAIVEGEVTA